MEKTKVLIVDDSALMRQLLSDILASDPELEVVGVASDPLVAEKKILIASPDVMTLDVEMPRMDGLTFLEKLMRVRPLPVVMVSSLTERGCETTIRALELGAVDFVSKPKLDIRAGTVDLASEIIGKVKAAARARVRKGRTPPAQVSALPRIRGTHRLIAVGASTGGTEALVQMLAPLPAGAPAIVIVQHMPERFTTAFATRLNALCRIEVREARDGDRAAPGLALLAPGNFHMELRRSGAEYYVRVFSSDPVNRHRPSVDVLFQSCAAAAGRNAVGVILTGMGDDGARGLLAMRQAGAHTVAQDEQSCVVFGMPKEAIERGAAESTLPLRDIAAAALRLAG